MRTLIRVPIIAIITPLLCLLALKAAPLLGSILVAVYQALQSLF